MMQAILVLALAAQDPIPVEGQPLAAQVERLIQALEFLGSPLAPDVRAALSEAGRDGARIQRLLAAPPPMTHHTCSRPAALGIAAVALAGLVAMEAGNIAVLTAFMGCGPASWLSGLR